MPIRLLAVDLDGTLLRSDQTPHPESAARLREAERRGIAVVLASGRVGPIVRSFADAVGLSGPVVGNNGADAFDAEGRTLSSHRLPPDLVEAILEWILAEGATASVYTGRHVYRFGEPNPEVSGQADKLGIDHVGAPPLDDTAKFLFVVPPSGQESLAAALREVIGDRADFVHSDPKYLEVLPPGVSKKTGLDAVLDHLGLSWEQTAAVGDWMNDYEMVVAARLGAAMTNAHPDLRAAADLVVPTNEAAGVAALVDRILAESGG